jgi:inner membrane protein
VRWFTHQGIGVGLAVVAARALDQDTAATVELAAAAFVGATLPDADLALRLRHRGITHSLAACAAVTWLALATGLAGLAIGYASHVAADACTPAGVRAFAPLSRKAVHLLPKPARIPTGSLRELVFALAFAAVCAAVTLP